MIRRWYAPDCVTHTSMGPVVMVAVLMQCLCQMPKSFKVVVEVKFSEWTADGKLRQPIYLGTRTNKPAREITREIQGLPRFRLCVSAERVASRPIVSDHGAARS